MELGSPDYLCPYSILYASFPPLSAKFTWESLAQNIGVCFSKLRLKEWLLYLLATKPFQCVPIRYRFLLFFNILRSGLLQRHDFNFVSVWWMVRIAHSKSVLDPKVYQPRERAYCSPGRWMIQVFVPCYWYRRVTLVAGPTQLKGTRESWTSWISTTRSRTD
jgi:hypothetical protein